MRTGEAMALAHTAQPATGAVLACVGRVDFGDAHAMLLRLAGNALTDKPMLPKAHASSQGSASKLPLLWLGDMQVFKDEYGVFRCPLDQLFGRLLSKGAGALALLATKPFQNTSDAAGVLVVCLTGRKLGLQAGTRLCGPSVFDLDGFAADEEFSAIRVNGHQGIGFIQVNANRQSSLRRGDFQGQGHTPDEFPMALKNREAIDLFGVLKRGFEVFWNRVAEALASCYRPNRHLTILKEGGITPALSHQKERTGFLEEKRTPGRFLVGLSRVIRPCHQANRRNGHLCIQCSLHPMIIPTLQGQGIQWLALIEAGFGECLLNLSEGFNRTFQVAVRRYNDGDGSLYLHGGMVSRRACPVKLLTWKECGHSSPRLKAGAPLPQLVEMPFHKP